jgi:hypothetical protein
VEAGIQATLAGFLFHRKQRRTTHHYDELQDGYFVKKMLEMPSARSVITGMSVAELKRAVDTLSLEDRLELADYLRRRSKHDDPQWETELARRLDRCLEGKGHTADELMALHDRLSAEGR